MSIDTTAIFPGWTCSVDEDTTTMLTEEMQRQTTDESCEMFDLQLLYQLGQQSQTSSVPSITHNSRKCRAVKRGEGQADGDTKPSINTHRANISEQ